MARYKPYDYRQRVLLPVSLEDQLKPGTLEFAIHTWWKSGEEVKRSMEWLIKRLIKVGARVSYHARRWYVHIASAFPLAHHYRAVLAWGS